MYPLWNAATQKRVAVTLARAPARISSICATLSFTSAFVASRCSSNGSPMARPMVIRGFSALYGSWKMYCICGRIVRSSRWGSLNRSCPLNSTSSRCSMACSWRDW